MPSGDVPTSAPSTQVAEFEVNEAQRWMRTDPRERRQQLQALAIALVLHGTALFAQLPSWTTTPVRVDAPAAQEMKVQFLKPPPPAPPKAAPVIPDPLKKKVPRPDPTPDEPEPVVARPPEPAPATSDAPGTPSAAPAQMGPVRVQAGQGPGLIKKVEPVYPPMARAARIAGTVVLDAIIQEDGTVSDVKVLKSGHKMLEQSAVDAVRQWRFTPGRYQVVLTVTVNFQLQ